MSGRLVVCPTPIGNLEDVTLRVLRALNEADTIACEDTRTTRKLLARHGIEGAKLVSYHEHNERRRARELVERVKRGQTVALCSDAGTPGVSDPGYVVIDACVRAGFEIDVLPGPSAIVTALIAAALPVERWRFTGFLPRRRAELRAELERDREALVAFESPRRLAATLALLAEIDSERQVAVCRELTKLHQQVVRGTAFELAKRFREGARGEVVLVIAPAAGDESSSTVDLATARNAVERLVETGARRRAAASIVASLTGLSANSLYGK